MLAVGVFNELTDRYNRVARLSPAILMMLPLSVYAVTCVPIAVTVWGNSKDPRPAITDYMRSLLNQIGFKATSKILNQTGPAVIITRAAHTITATRNPEDGLYEPEIDVVGTVRWSRPSGSMNPMPMSNSVTRVKKAHP